MVCGHLSFDFVPHNSRDINGSHRCPSAANTGVIPTGGDSAEVSIITISLFPQLPSFSPSLIRLVVTVDVRHHSVCLFWAKLRVAVTVVFAAVK